MRNLPSDAGLDPPKMLRRWCSIFATQGSHNPTPPALSLSYNTRARSASPAIQAPECGPWPGPATNISYLITCKPLAIQGLPAAPRDGHHADTATRCAPDVAVPPHRKQTPGGVIFLPQTLAFVDFCANLRLPRAPARVPACEYRPGRSGHKRESNNLRSDANAETLSPLQQLPLPRRGI